MGYNARAEPLFCSLNLLFSDVRVAVCRRGYLKLPSGLVDNDLTNSVARAMSPQGSLVKTNKGSFLFKITRPERYFLGKILVEGSVVSHKYSSES